MNIGNYQISASLVPTVAVLVVFSGLIGLGVWQLARADEKREIEASVRLVEKKVPFELNDMNVAEPERLLAEIYRPVAAVGLYDSQHQFLYDNRTHKGKPGYHVLSPFVIKGKDVAVLVNRGWIPFNGRRDNIQDITVNDSEFVLAGIIRNPSRSIVLSDDVASASDYPLTIQAINLADMGKTLGYKFLPIIIELDKSATNGFVREWQPYYGSIAKHTAYAVQWFVMAVVLLMLFVKMSLKKKTEN